MVRPVRPYEEREAEAKSTAKGDDLHFYTQAEKMARNAALAIEEMQNYIDGIQSRKLREFAQHHIEERFL